MIFVVWFKVIGVFQKVDLLKLSSVIESFIVVDEFARKWSFKMMLKITLTIFKIICVANKANPFNF